MHSVLNQKTIFDESSNFNENGYETIVYPSYQEFLKNLNTMQNSSINPNDGSENSEIYHHFD